MLERYLASPRPTVLLLSGAVGAGHTAAVQALAIHARAAGAAVRVASAARSEQLLDLGVVRQLVPTPVPISDEETALHRLSDDCADRPAVFIVDDAQLTDRASVRVLRRLITEAGRQPLVVLADSPGVTPRPVEERRLLAVAEVHARRLLPATTTAVAGLLADRCPPRLARAALPLVVRVTGGNQALVAALVEDIAAGPATTAGEAGAPGDSLRDAVQAGLHRCDPAVAELVEILAVAGTAPDSAVLDRLSDPGVLAAVRERGAAVSAGLLRGDRIRHPLLARAVLDGLAVERRAALHRRLAVALHEAGARPEDQARHLLGGGRLDVPWSVQVLHAAGERHLDEGRTDEALSCLRQAAQHCLPGRMRAKVVSTLARAEWRQDARAVVRHLPVLTQAVRDGHASPVATASTLRHLMWHGRPEEAVELAGHAVRRLDAEQCTTEELMVTLRWLSYLYPGTGRAALPAPVLRRMRKVLRGTRPHRRSVRPGPGESPAGGLAGALHSLGTEEADLWAAFWALTGLLQDERLEETEQSCARLAELAERRQNTTVAALVSAMRAIIALSRGDLRGADQLTEHALSTLPVPGWGIVVGLPLAVRAQALTLLGRTSEVRAILRTPVPAAMAETPIGLAHLAAQGRCLLALDRPAEALWALERCGELARRWPARPGGVRWRADAARACLELDRPRVAARLARQELQLLPGGQRRARSSALRALAATMRPDERVPALREALCLARQCGDAVGVAQSSFELADAYGSRHEAGLARQAYEAAATIARQIGLADPGRTATAPSATKPTDPAVAMVPGLTLAESRVAALAALGHSNRDIGGRLFITVSTVEQHLTRVYRKLGASDRADLTARIRSRQATTAPADNDSVYVAALRA
ncbi:LuxR C-terminal-related transcriptional regulator [Micromonospora sp. NPDC048898]|uniref:helix-turn-helix transcriptional regulator n=1 Tax=Micromonospora sp. NPDC048898 TaxID=3364260 RepID=UPI0037143B07